MSLKEDIQSLLAAEGVRPNKNRGQHFLVNKEALRTITEKAAVTPGQTVLEIGAGVGNLTHELVAAGAHVVAVEKDETLVGVLRRLMAEAPVEVMSADVRDINPQTFPEKYTVVGNIPYYITAPIVQQFLLASHQPQRIVLTIQKEVGERLAAEPPKATFLSNLVQMFATVEVGPVIGAEHFWPRPQVDSIVVTLTPHTAPDEKTKNLIALIRAGFKQPRKTLFNNLRSAGYEDAVVKEALDLNGLNQKARAHELSLNQWRTLQRTLR